MPPEILCLAIATAHGDEARTGHQDIAFSSALNAPGCAGRLLRLDAESLTSALGRAEQSLGPTEIRTRMLGGERVVTIRRRPPARWMDLYYFGREA